MDLLQIGPSARNESGVKDHVPTKIVTLKVRLGDGEHVNPDMHLFQEGKSRAGVKEPAQVILAHKHSHAQRQNGQRHSMVLYADTRCRVTSQA
jgi:hypothetical protein